VMLQLRVFYAMGDARTPTLINVFMVGTKITIVLVCSAVFDDPAKIAVSLTTGTSASYVIGAVVGHVCLTRRLGQLGFSRVLNTVVRVLIASALGGLAAFGVGVVVQNAFGDARLGALLTLVVGGLVGLLVLGLVLWRLNVREIREIAATVRG
jgi:putative peptidoglycan lipid II flippase